MSSTQRGYERHKNDKYCTPEWLAKEAAWLVKTYAAAFFRNSPLILEPAVGNGVLVKALQEALPEASIRHSDIAPEGYPTTKVDFFDIKDCGWDVIITNPPYVLAKKFIEHSLALVKDGGLIFMLLRLNFLGGQKRSNWLKANMPYHVHVTPRRPKFLGTKGTDSCEYAWFVWKRGWVGETSLSILDTGKK